MGLERAEGEHKAWGLPQLKSSSSDPRSPCVSVSLPGTTVHPLSLIFTGCHPQLEYGSQGWGPVCGCQALSPSPIEESVYCFSDAFGGSQLGTCPSAWNVLIPSPCLLIRLLLIFQDPLSSRPQSPLHCFHVCRLPAGRTCV